MARTALGVVAVARRLGTTLSATAFLPPRPCPFDCEGAFGSERGFCSWRCWPRPPRPPRSRARRVAAASRRDAAPAISRRCRRVPCTSRRSIFFLIRRSIASISGRSSPLTKRDRLAFQARAAGAADAVHVILGDVRQVVVDDVRQRLDVEAARGDVGRDQHADLARLETLERADARVLRLVAVDRVGVDAVAHELAREAVGAVLGLAEDEHLAPVVWPSRGARAARASSRHRPSTRTASRARPACCGARLRPSPGRAGTARRACGSRRRTSPRRAGSAGSAAAG